MGLAEGASKYMKIGCEFTWDSLQGYHLKMPVHKSAMTENFGYSVQW